MHQDFIPRIANSSSRPRECKQISPVAHCGTGTALNRGRPNLCKADTPKELTKARDVFFRYLFNGFRGGVSTREACTTCGQYDIDMGSYGPLAQLSYQRLKIITHKMALDQLVSCFLNSIHQKITTFIRF
jgi:hypothetical protein